MKSFCETTKTVFEPLWIKKEFLPYDEVFRAARSRMKEKLNKCQKCKRPFEEGEMMALACFKKKGNKPLCRKCADELDT